MDKHYPLYLTDTELEEVRICSAERLTKLKAEQKKKDLSEEQSARLFSTQAVIENVQEKTSMLIDYIRKTTEAETARREAIKLKSLYERFAMAKETKKND